MLGDLKLLEEAYKVVMAEYNLVDIINRDNQKLRDNGL